jgi:hypothetical protein
MAGRPIRMSDAIPRAVPQAQGEGSRWRHALFATARSGLRVHPKKADPSTPRLRRFARDDRGGGRGGASPLLPRAPEPAAAAATLW